MPKTTRVPAKASVIGSGRTGGVLPPGRGDLNVYATAAEESEARAILASFDARLTEAERRIDKVLARLGID